MGAFAKQVACLVMSLYTEGELAPIGLCECGCSGHRSTLGGGHEMAAADMSAYCGAALGQLAGYCQHGCILHESQHGGCGQHGQIAAAQAYGCLFIGHLQRNKVKQVVGKVALIQSVGSVALLDEIEKTAEKLDIVQDILLEVNIGGEEAKSGFAPQELEEAARYAVSLAHVRVLGLMTIPPVEKQPHGNMPFFTRMRKLFVDINQKIYDNKLKYLSMGMSGDFADAIEAGGNMVRVGTAIFGARNYSK